MHLDQNQFNELSQYAKFHFKYLGYDMQSLSTGMVYTKGIFWDKFRSIAVKYSDFSNKPKAPQGFALSHRITPNEYQAL
jgi:hypothetical protein